MATKITQIGDAESGNVILRIEGSLEHEDALLIEKIASETQSCTSGNVIVDLADLNFLDSEAASVLRKLCDKGFQITGLEIFLQKAVNEVESKDCLN